MCVNNLPRVVLDSGAVEIQTRATCWSQVQHHQHAAPSHTRLPAPAHKILEWPASLSDWLWLPTCYISVCTVHLAAANCIAVCRLLRSAWFVPILTRRLAAFCVFGGRTATRHPPPAVAVSSSSSSSSWKFNHLLVCSSCRRDVTVLCAPALSVTSLGWTTRRRCRLRRRRGLLPLITARNDNHCLYSRLIHSAAYARASYHK